MDFNLSFSTADIFRSQPELEPDNIYDLLIIGAGPAGLNAALYAKRKGLDVAIITKRKGGQILDTSTVDNYLGFANISGEGLVDEFLNHVEKLEIPILEDTEVIDTFSDNLIHQIVLSTGETYKTKTLLVATGSKPRQLDVPGEIKYAGKGVAYCAICDAPLFKNRNVFIAGGGNSAVEAALDIAKFANSVTLIHRSQLRADKILVDQLYSHSKISVYLKTKILEITGDDVMTGLSLENTETLKQFRLKGDGIFIEIGHTPNIGPFKDILKLNERGEIITNERKETNIPGIFAAGDITNSMYKQIIIAASDGAIAALAINEYINQNKL
ncbi:alkyl hydroperoxide reductase subunit F [Clostridium saccharoperbutylacetonicum]|uniref:Thioredoxin reductase TrxB n=1 Tax=Clostridium saccharoperbutylacetonicum N1-4(HMT) TaxID=931276 RepID=M1MC30_9CLOT|nr:FAD-dependent oxidoreductase [Clostridium saccharoperbutylacetonicum]AGF55489.1 thioredoxin reductase TrxB [Clostridium saccharoperbutylacetonicum N1-4(HMT)]NRT63793.1 alkyl hydroperoxide reductase subunit F [Clostridium saccharoperbutylacetonicum]NSB27156.1 alkyl hydroperoxide reductase subunit F [Clostridium saccharoperbutylacetonicum]NSB40642.1 alkyl hydroperoxide reductase subunit F [Clostridium saccharoperbutylacetonicum]